MKKEKAERGITRKGTIRFTFSGQGRIGERVLLMPVND